MSCRKSPPALILGFLHHSLIQKLFTNYSVRRPEPSTSSMATARMETIRGPTSSMARAIGGYHMAKKFHVLMPLFTLPPTVKVTHCLVQNAYVNFDFRMSSSIYNCQDWCHWSFIKLMSLVICKCQRRFTKRQCQHTVLLEDWYSKQELLYNIGHLSSKK